MIRVEPVPANGVTGRIAHICCASCRVFARHSGPAVSIEAAAERLRIEQSGWVSFPRTDEDGSFADHLCPDCSARHVPLR